METWVIANQKGGVGKTTTTITLAGILTDLNYRVLLIDLDPQASLSLYMGVQTDSLSHSVYDVFAADSIDASDFPQPVIGTSTKCLDLLPATINLATLDKLFGQRKGLGLRLSKYIEKLDGQYDYVLVDCPPVLGVLMINALVACQQLIIPCQTEYLAIKGMERMLKTLDMVYKPPREAPNIVIVPTMYDKRTRACVDSLRHMRQHFEDKLWRSVISIDTSFRNASQAHALPSRYAEDSRGVAEYQQLCSDILKGAVNPIQKAALKRA